MNRFLGLLGLWMVVVVGMVDATVVWARVV